MDLPSLLLAVLIGIIQGIFEWLPISSEGNITLLLTVLGTAPERAVQYSLFLHVGTAIAATAYYRDELTRMTLELRSLHTALGSDEDFRFLLIATLVSGVIGILAYKFLIATFTAVEGSYLIILIGVLLVATGFFQRITSASDLTPNHSASVFLSVLVGIGQGLAVLPGVSRSGTTVGILLLRGYDGQTAFRLSFLLSIPAALGAGLLVVLDSGGLPGIPLSSGLTALLFSGVVGYASIDVLVRTAQRVSFWSICAGLGSLAIVGGLLTLLL